MAKRKEEPEMIPPKEYAERAGAKYQTVMLWLRQNLIPGAQKFALPTGGHYYLVPADAPRPQTQRGPKPKKGVKRGGSQTDQAAANDADEAEDQADDAPAKPKRRVSNRTAAKKALKKMRKKAAGN